MNTNSIICDGFRDRGSKWMSSPARSRDHCGEAHRRTVNPVYKVLRDPPKRASGNVCFLLTFEYMDVGIPRKWPPGIGTLKSPCVPAFRVRAKTHELRGPVYLAFRLRSTSYAWQFARAYQNASFARASPPDHRRHTIRPHGIGGSPIPLWRHLLVEFCGSPEQVVRRCA